jgi:hypothetical protein
MSKKKLENSMEMHALSYKYIQDLEKMAEDECDVLNEMCIALCAISSLWQLTPGGMDELLKEISECYRSGYAGARERREKFRKKNE